MGFGFRRQAQDRNSLHVPFLYPGNVLAASPRTKPGSVWSNWPDSAPASKSMVPELAMTSTNPSMTSPSGRQGVR